MEAKAVATGVRAAAAAAAAPAEGIGTGVRGGGWDDACLQASTCSGKDRQGFQLPACVCDE
jgi:hypothetical protein